MARDLFACVRMCARDFSRLRNLSSEEPRDMNTLENRKKRHPQLGLASARSIRQCCDAGALSAAVSSGEANALLSRFYVKRGCSKIKGGFLKEPEEQYGRNCSKHPDACRKTQKALSQHHLQTKYLRTDVLFIQPALHMKPSQCVEQAQRKIT